MWRCRPPDGQRCNALDGRLPRAAHEGRADKQRQNASGPETMIPTPRLAFQGILLVLGLITAMMSTGCDQVRQRLTPSATEAKTSPPAPSAAPVSAPPGSAPSAPSAPAAPSVTPSTPATSAVPALPVVPAIPTTPMSPSSPAVAPSTPVERYSSHQGSSGVGPVERRQSSSGARP